MMMRAFTLIALLLIGATVCSLSAARSQSQSHYATMYNHFAPLTAADREAASRVREQGNYLMLDNTISSPLLLLDSARYVGEAFTYSVRFSNHHNRPDGSYRVTDVTTGRRSKVTDPYCGIVFAYRDADDWWAVTMRMVSVGVTDDMMPKREMIVNVMHHSARADSVTFEKRFSDGFDLSVKGENTLSLSVEDGVATLQGGHKKLAEMFSFAAPVGTSQGRVGCVAGGGSLLAVDRTALIHKERTEVRRPTGWTRAGLDAHFAASVDPLEGYYSYLDRDLDDRLLRLGGRYTVAVVAAADTTYDIIYVDGAQVRGSEWQTGMLKGRLLPTVFADHYDLRWIDATFEPIDPDAYAINEQQTILTLHFPLYRSQIRLVRRRR